MGWLQRVEAGRQTKIERQNALHRGFQEPTSDLWFRLTHAQRHRSVSILVLCALGLALAGVVIGRSQAIYAIAVLLIDEVTGRGAATYPVAGRKDGRRVRLGAPWNESAVGDPDFDTKLERILASCRVQAIVAGSGSSSATTTRKTGP